MIKRAAIAAILFAILAPAGAAAQDEVQGGPSSESAVNADSETLGQGLSALNSGIGNFGEVGAKLTDLKSGEFVGRRVIRNARRAEWNGLFGKVRGASEATNNSVPFKLASDALFLNDIADGVVAPLAEGDGRGAMSGAVNIAINDAVVAAGSTAFAALGAAVGSVVPFAGTAAGASLGVTVGGAIGSVAGGFITSIAFDRFGKSFIADIVEGAVASLMDTSDLQQAMNARDEYERAQAAPELQRAWNDLHAVSAGFGEESVELPSVGYTPYIVKTKPPENAAAGADVLVGATSFEILLWSPEHPDTKGKQTCTVSGQGFVCHGEDNYSCNRFKQIISGTIQGGHLEGTIVYDGQLGGCSTCVDYTHGVGHVTFDLTPDGRAPGLIGPVSWKDTSIVGDCGGRELRQWIAPGGKFDGSWRKLD